MKDSNLINTICNPYLIFANGIGDHILVLPTIRALFSIFKDKLSIIIQKGSFAKEIFKEISFKEIVEIEFMEDSVGRRFNSKKLSGIISNCDCLISLNPWGYGLDIIDLLNSLKKIKLSIGFYDCFDIIIPFNLNIHNADLNFQIAKSLDSKLNINDFSYPPLFETKYQEIIKKNKPNDTQLISIHFDTEKEKMWSKSKFIKLTNSLMNKYKNLIVIPLGMDNKSFIKKLEHKDRVLEYEFLPFNIACSYVAQSDYFIGVDSVFLHVADFYRIKGIGIFGPTNPIEFGFRFSHQYFHANSSNKKTNTISVSEVENLFKQLQ